jgi:transposase InsO family protein
MIGLSREVMAELLAEVGREGRSRFGDLRVNRGLYNPRRRHSALAYLSPVQFEDLHTAAVTAA